MSRVLLLQQKLYLNVVIIAIGTLWAIIWNTSSITLDICISIEILGYASISFQYLTNHSDIVITGFYMC